MGYMYLTEISIIFTLTPPGLFLSGQGWYTAQRCLCQCCSPLSHADRHQALAKHLAKHRRIHVVALLDSSNKSSSSSSSA